METLDWLGYISQPYLRERNRLVLLLLLAISLCQSDIIVRLNDGREIHYANNYVFSGPRVYNVTARVVTASPIDGCDLNKQNRSAIFGAIVVVDDHLCLFQDKLKQMTRGGAVGVIFQLFDHYGVDYWDRSDGHYCPGSWFVPNPLRGDLQSISDLIDEGRVVNITMSTAVNNAWIDFTRGPGGILFQIILGSCLMGGIMLGSIRLRRIILVNGFQPTTTAQSYYLFQLSGFTIALLYEVDPLRFHPFFPRYMDAFLLVLNAPFHACARALIIFYWQEVLSGWNPDLHNSHLSKFKRPFIITAIILFGLEISFSAVRYVYITGDILYYNLVAYGVVLAVNSIYFTVLGVKVYRIIWTKKRDNSDGQYSNHIWKMYLLIICSNVCVVLCLLFCILLATPFTRISPFTQVFAWGGVIFFLFLSNLLQMLTVSAPKQDLFQTNSTDVDRNGSREAGQNSSLKGDSQSIHIDSVCIEETQESDREETDIVEVRNVRRRGQPDEWQIERMEIGSESLEKVVFCISGCSVVANQVLPVGEAAAEGLFFLQEDKGKEDRRSQGIGLLTGFPSALHFFERFFYPIEAEAIKIVNCITPEINGIWQSTSALPHRSSTFNSILEMAVYGHGCVKNDCPGGVKRYYLPENSTSSTLEPCDSSLCLAIANHRCTKSKHCQQRYDYEDDSWWTGALVHDVISFADRSSKLPVLFAEVLRTSGSFEAPEADGILGVGLNDDGSISPALDRICVDNSLDKAFYLALYPDRTGRLSIGMSDTTIHQGELSSVPMVTDAKGVYNSWSVQLNSLSVGDTNIDSSIVALLDTGTTYTLLPPRLFEGVTEVMKRILCGGEDVLQCICSDDSFFEGKKVCNVKRLDHLPEITWNFGQVKVTTLAREYLPVTPSGLYQYGFVNSTDNVVLLGNSFLISKYASSQRPLTAWVLTSTINVMSMPTIVRMLSSIYKWLYLSWKQLLPLFSFTVGIMHIICQSLSHYMTTNKRYRCIMRPTALLILLFTSSLAVNNGLGKTPQMGWNSWTGYFCNINETIIRDTVDTLVNTGLAALGYKYVNVDDCWAGPRDEQGQITSDPKTFPSGMKALADYAHSKGLLFGLYSDAGTKTCAGRPGSLNYEEIDAKTYSDWGIDYLKYDNCFNENVPPKERYPKMGKALLSQSHPIFYSLCEWGQDNPGRWAPKVANSWRTTDDIQDNWYSIMWNLFNNDYSGGSAGPGAWNDPDMLQVGNGNLPVESYRAHFSLWCAVKAPLIIGTNINKASKDTMDILSNAEAIAINQDPMGKQARLVEHTPAYQIWRGPLENGDYALVLLNHAYAPVNVTVNLRKHFKTSSASFRDIWAKEDVGVFNGSFVSPAIIQHSALFYRGISSKVWVLEQRYMRISLISGWLNMVSFSPLLWLCFVGHVMCLNPIIISGNKFFDSITQQQFYVVGVDYQPSPDPISDLAGLRRDIPLMRDLGINTIRCYQIDPAADHDEGMKLLNDAGIYVLIDAASPSASIISDAPAWTTDIFASFRTKMDEFMGYTNLLGYISANEVVIQSSQTPSAAYVKAAVRDMKSYLRSKGKNIPVGYAATDVEAAENFRRYLDCGDASTTVDFYGVNIYRWCGSTANLQTSGYEGLRQLWSSSAVPIIFTEYGCNQPSPRTFNEIAAIYNEMTSVLSGGFIYEYHQEENGFGLVNLTGSSFSILPDYVAAKQQLSKIRPPRAQLPAQTPILQRENCPAVSNSWESSPSLPPTPNAPACQCMWGQLPCRTDSEDMSTVTVDTAKNIGNTLDYICGNFPSACTAISGDSKSGTYGTWSHCDPLEKVSWAMNSWYNQYQSIQGASACDFGGLGKVQAPKVSQSCGDQLKFVRPRYIIPIDDVHLFNFVDVFHRIDIVHHFNNVDAIHNIDIVHFINYIDAIHFINNIDAIHLVYIIEDVFYLIDFFYLFNNIDAVHLANIIDVFHLINVDAIHLIDIINIFHFNDILYHIYINAVDLVNINKVDAIDIINSFNILHIIHILHITQVNHFIYNICIFLIHLPIDIDHIIDDASIYNDINIERHYNIIKPSHQVDFNSTNCNLHDDYTSSPDRPLKRYEAFLVWSVHLWHSQLCYYPLDFQCIRDDIEGAFLCPSNQRSCRGGCYLPGQFVCKRE
ncbi:hypothetical protein PROFUN_01250 [Planoprotostelium fungivorum]|uniref:Alpha-galactosidase n=1 Tax=Planoprotostelium fungivorum TaxID=1890364 RepID=A0A2P6NZL4_9EUKA|nr:hypothetical protein PROFUN_01250 [Planoprotostelium fungivorum]